MGAFCSFSASAVAKVAGGAGEEGSALGLVPGLPIAGCGMRAGSAEMPESKAAEEPEPDSLMWAPWWDGAGAWSQPRGCFSAGAGSPSAALEPGQIAPAEECCRNPTADAQGCSRRLYIPEMYPACWCAAKEACGLGVKGDECLGAVNILPVPGIQLVLEMEELQCL